MESGDQWKLAGGPVVRLGRRVKGQYINNLIKARLEHFVYDALVGRNRMTMCRGRWVDKLSLPLPKAYLHERRN